MQISSSYTNAITAKCNDSTDPNMACQIAANVVNGSCLLLLHTADPTVCSGTCGTQASTAATTCASIVSL